MFNYASRHKEVQGKRGIRARKLNIALQGSKVRWQIHFLPSVRRKPAAVAEWDGRYEQLSVKCNQRLIAM